MCFNYCPMYLIFGPPPEAELGPTNSLSSVCPSVRLSVRLFVCPFVCPFVRSRSQNPFIGLFWFLAQSCSIIVYESDIFAFSQKNPVCPILAPKLSKLAHFGPKSVVLINFSKSSHMILLIFLIETTFVNSPVKVLGKIFLGLF